jgi:photosystem II stability/assembly factor-like uncharacterized protein
MVDGIRLYAGTQRGLLVWRMRNGNWEQVSHEFQSAVFDTIAGCAQRPERVYAAVAWDGIYRTDDGGRHWGRVMEGEIRAITVDPTDDSVVYAGTEPVHLYRSEDGGDHWEELAGLQDQPDEVRKKWWTPYPPATGHIRYIFVHPDDPSILKLCLEHGGVLRSFDRGATWEDVSEGIEYLDMHMVKSFPHRTDRYYCSSARGFYTSEDPGDGWVRAENGLTWNYTHDFLFLEPGASGDVPTMLIAVADGSPGFWRRESRGANAAIFRSSDGAHSWQRSVEGLPENMDHMVWALASHPTDANVAFAGVGATNRGQTVDTFTDESAALTGAPGQILLSSDRGQSWQRLPLELPADRVLWAAAD